MCFLESTHTHVCVDLEHTYVFTYDTSGALIARVCVPGEHMCVPRVHTCVSDLDTRFILFQVNTCLFHVYACVSKLDTRFILFQVNTHGNTLCVQAHTHVRTSKTIMRFLEHMHVHTWTPPSRAPRHMALPGMVAASGEDGLFGVSTLAGAATPAATAAPLGRAAPGRPERSPGGRWASPERQGTRWAGGRSARHTAGPSPGSAVLGARWKTRVLPRLAATPASSWTERATRSKVARASSGRVTRYKSSRNASSSSPSWSCGCRKRRMLREGEQNRGQGIALFTALAFGHVMTGSLGVPLAHEGRPAHPCAHLITTMCSPRTQSRVQLEHTCVHT